MPFQHKYSIQQQKQFMKQNKYINQKNKSQNKVQDRKEKKNKKKKKMVLCGIRTLAYFTSPTERSVLTDCATGPMLHINAI